jgi:hypothetical protein
MKRYLSCNFDFEAFKVGCSECYMNPYNEESPERYPAIIVYREVENTDSYKPEIHYEFVYPNDFDINIDVKRNQLKSELDKTKTYTIEYEDPTGWISRCYANCSVATVLHHYDVAKKMNCNLIIHKE